MKDRPIIFSRPMVRALLDGRKTQTRRVLKPQPPLAAHHEPVRFETRNADKSYWVWMCCTDRPSYQFATGNRMAPYIPGQLLWVRETWTLGADQENDDGFVIYRTDGLPYFPIGKWRSPIYMPRWASRLTLEITDVRVQRVQDISEEDARAEGVYYQGPTAEDLAWYESYCAEHSIDSKKDPMTGVWRVPGVRQGWGDTKVERGQDTWSPTAVFGFRLLWDSIHGPGAWDRNDWVAALTFTVHKCNIDDFKRERAA